MWTVTALCLTVVVAVISAQPDDAECGNLGFSRPRPRIRGDNLPVCRSSEEQCCSSEYLEGVQERVRERLEKFLRKEFDDVIEEYQDEVDNLLEYFTRYFPGKLLQNLPNFEDFTDNPAIRPILENLIDNFEIVEGDDDFDVGDFLERLIGILTRVGARLLGRGGDTAECIAGVLESLVDRATVDELRGLLRRVRRGITALMRIGRFLERQGNRLEGARVLQRCVARFTEISVCSRCTRKTPPLCFGTCNALVRGCYSPYYTVLNGQYRRLWREVQRIVQLLNTTVEDVGEIELINFGDVLREVREQCGVSGPSENNRGKRQRERSKERTTPRMDTSRSSKTNDTGSGSGEEEDTSRSSRTSKGTSRGTSRSTTTGKSTGTSTTTTGKSTGDSTTGAVLDIAGDVEFIPLALVEEVFELNGAFEYGRRGRDLRFCSDALHDEEDEDYESCPPPGQEMRQCRVDDVCTSKCYCTDGRGNVTRDNETDLVYDDSDVEDQGNNPVLGISEEELMDEMNRITAMGDPVASFLDSDEFRSVDPGVEEEERVDDGEGSAAGLGASLCALLLAVTATLLF